MSAYEEAWDAFRGVLTDVELDRLLTAVERETAHECAEKIRTDNTRACAIATQQYFANLIDPEVSDAPQEEAAGE
jgi:hypothetical protein